MPRCAVELGVTLIDTADSCGPYVFEDITREALHDGSGYGDASIATRAGLTRHGPDVWRPLARPEHLRQHEGASTSRLALAHAG